MCLSFYFKHTHTLRAKIICCYGLNHTETSSKGLPNFCKHKVCRGAQLAKWSLYQLHVIKSYHSQFIQKLHRYDLVTSEWTDAQHAVRNAYTRKRTRADAVAHMRTRADAVAHMRTLCVY